MVTNNSIPQNDSKSNLSVNVRSRAANMEIIRQHCDPEILTALRTDKSGNRLNKLLYRPGYKFKRRDPITIGSRTIISLTQGLTTIVDTEYAYLIFDKKWHVQKHGSTWYAARNIRDDGRFVHEYMHRVIYETMNGPVAPDLEVDHIDNNGLNNKLSNLRAVTHRVNMLNSQKRNAGEVVGASWHKRARSWMSYIRIHGISYYLGLYPTKERASAVSLEAFNKYEQHGILPHRKPRNSKEAVAA